MRHLIIAIFLTTVALLQGQEPHVIDGVAAVVNKDVITFSQVRIMTGGLENQMRVSQTGDALMEKVREVRLRAVNSLIDRQLMIQEFRKLKGASIPTHVVDDRITALIRDEFGGDRATFLKTIAAQGLTIEQLRKMEEEKIIVSAMRAREIKGEPMVPKSKVEAFYNEHKHEWTTNDEVKLRILKIFPGTAPASKRKMIDEIREKIVRGGDFGDLARLYSEDSTQEKSGDWGWVKRKELNPEMEQAVFRLQKGKVSEVLTLSPGGATAYYLLLAEDRKPGVTKPLSELRPQIERHLAQVERQKMEQGWIDRLRKKAYIKIY
jgi:peptidyl-prolyl cis-trans isomerase SurA